MSLIYNKFERIRFIQRSLPAAEMKEDMRQTII